VHTIAVQKHGLHPWNCDCPTWGSIEVGIWNSWEDKAENFFHLIKIGIAGQE